MLFLFTSCSSTPEPIELEPREPVNASTSANTSSSSEDASADQLIPVVSTRDPQLPTPDPETSDMDTFTPNTDGFPNINNGEMKLDSWIEAFRNEYTGKRIRIAYLVMYGPYVTPTGFYMVSGDWYFEIDQATVDNILDFQDVYGPDGLEYVVDGIVADHTAPNQTECNMLLTDCNVEVAMGVPWWKDQHYGDNPYGDGDYGDYDSDYNDYDNGDTYHDDYVYIDPNTAVEVNARTICDNIERSVYNYKDCCIKVYNLEVHGIYEDSIYATSIYSSGHTTSCNMFYFDDFAASGAINLNDGDQITVIGLCTGKYVGLLVEGLKLEHCTFYKGGRSIDSIGDYYGVINDEFSNVMDQIYGQGWEGAVFP